MPSIPIFQRDNADTLFSAMPDEPDKSSSRIWLIVAIIISVLLLVAVLVGFIVTFLRQRRYDLDKTRDPYQSHDQDLRRRRLTPEQRQQQEDFERAYMIRKSLASRSSGLISEADRRSSVGEERRNSEPGVDWKEWEARMDIEHPYWSSEHPATRSESGITVPRETKQ
jgi:hypothetical protein